MNATDRTKLFTDETEETCALEDEALDMVVGGAFRFVRAVAHSGVQGTDTNLGSNTQLWVTSAT